MSAPAGNRTLSQAKRAKQDEFYTQLPDIANELKHYKKHLKGKTVLCNCDDPFESNFFQYFALNFNALGLKKLVCTSYDGSPIAGQGVLCRRQFAIFRWMRWRRFNEKVRLWVR